MDALVFYAAVHVNAAPGAGVALDRRRLVDDLKLVSVRDNLDLVTADDGDLAEDRALGLPALGAAADVIVRCLRSDPDLVSTAAENPATGRRNSLPLGDPELMLGRDARLGTRAARVAGVCQGALA
jgi:hypothetical protein